MWHRQLLTFMVVCVCSSVARADDAHENWLEYFCGAWTWTSSDGSSGEVTFEKYDKVPGLVVKEKNKTEDKSNVAVLGWASDSNMLVSSGYDSEGHQVTTCFKEITDVTLSGSRVRRSKGNEIKETWKVLRKGEDKYLLSATIDGEEISVTVVRK